MLLTVDYPAEIGMLRDGPGIGAGGSQAGLRSGECDRVRDSERAVGADHHLILAGVHQGNDDSRIVLFEQ